MFVWKYKLLSCSHVLLTILLEKLFVYFRNVPNIKEKQKKCLYLLLKRKDVLGLGLLWKKPDLPTFRNKVLTGQTQLIKHDLRVCLNNRFSLFLSHRCVWVF